MKAENIRDMIVDLLCNSDMKSTTCARILTLLEVYDDMIKEENSQSPQKQKIGKEETLGKSVSYADTPNNSEDTHSTKQGGHWEETEYQDGCHTHKDNVWVEDTKQELNKEISKDYA